MMWSGAERAFDLLNVSIMAYDSTKYVVLSGIVTRLESNAYKLQVLRKRLGHVWEFAFTDYWFGKLPRGNDLVNNRRKIAIELKMVTRSLQE